jgi:hypothetical protein
VSASIDAAAGAPEISRPAHGERKAENCRPFPACAVPSEGTFRERALRCSKHFFASENFNELACGTRTMAAQAPRHLRWKMCARSDIFKLHRARPGKLLIFLLASACHGANSGPISQRRKIIIARAGGKSFDGQTM